MSFIGRAEVWTHVSGPEDAVNGNRSPRMAGPTGSHFTPLDLMTGSRIAASRHGVVRWVGGQSWDEAVYAQRVAPRLADQLRRPYQHLFEALSRHTDRAPESWVCPRCGQAPHKDWGHEYERLVCMEITAA